MECWVVFIDETGEDCAITLYDVKVTEDGRVTGTEYDEDGWPERVSINADSITTLEVY